MTSTQLTYNAPATSARASRWAAWRKMRWSLLLLLIAPSESAWAQLPADTNAVISRPTTLTKERPPAPPTGTLSEQAATLRNHDHWPELCLLYHDQTRPLNAGERREASEICLRAATQYRFGRAGWFSKNPEICLKFLDLAKTFSPELSTDRLRWGCRLDLTVWRLDDAAALIEQMKKLDRSEHYSHWKRIDRAMQLAEQHVRKMDPHLKSPRARELIALAFGYRSLANIHLGDYRGENHQRRNAVGRRYLDKLKRVDPTHRMVGQIESLLKRRTAERALLIASLFALAALGGFLAFRIWRRRSARSRAQ